MFDKVEFSKGAIKCLKSLFDDRYKPMPRPSLFDDFKVEYRFDKSSSSDFEVIMDYNKIEDKDVWDMCLVIQDLKNIMTVSNEIVNKPYGITIKMIPKPNQSQRLNRGCVTAFFYDNCIITKNRLNNPDKCNCEANNVVYDFNGHIVENWYGG